MSSKVQICNLALVRLSGNRITSLTESTATAQLCNILYDDIADEVMMEGAWTSATVRTELALTSNTPSYGYTYEYQLPTNPKFLKILEVDEATAGQIPYRIEGDKLLTDETTMKIKYIGRVDDPQSYDVQLRRALITRLTAELAYPVTGQASSQQAWFQKYRQDVQSGLATDGQQGSNQTTWSSTLHDVR